MEISIDKSGKATDPRKGAGLVLALLVAVNTLIFIIGLWYPGMRESLMLHTSPHPVAPIVTAILNWRAMASYSFVHSGPAHLFFNMLFLTLIGRFLISKRGLYSMLLLYMTGIVAGGLGFLLATSFLPVASGNALCGASAGIVGMCGASMFLHPSRNYKILISLILLTSFFGNLTIEAFATHLFGFVAVVIIAFIFRPDFRNTEFLKTTLKL